MPTAVLWTGYARYFVSDDGFINLSPYFLPEWQWCAPVGMAVVALWRGPWLMRRLEITADRRGWSRIRSDAAAGILLTLLGLLLASLMVTVTVVLQEPSGTFELDALFITLIAPPLIAAAYVKGWLLLVPIAGALGGIAAGRVARSRQAGTV
jgi:hypothetical protein